MGLQKRPGFSVAWGLSGGTSPSQTVWKLGINSHAKLKGWGFLDVESWMSGTFLYHTKMQEKDWLILRGDALGCPLPSKSGQWSLEGFPTNNVIILLVTITGKGDTPRDTQTKDFSWQLLKAWPTEIGREGAYQLMSCVGAWSFDEEDGRVHGFFSLCIYIYLQHLIL